MKKKKNISPLLYLSFLGIAVFSGLVGYCFGSRAKQSRPVVATNLRQNPSYSPSPSPTADSIKSEFLSQLSAHCLNRKVGANNEIELSKLPFSLSEKVKDTYNIQRTVNCILDGENFAYIETRNGNMTDRTMYFFDQESKWFGMGDNFRPLSDYDQVAIDDSIVRLEIMSPGPHGISTLGVWVAFVVEKKDPKSGTIVRVRGFEIFKDQDIIDLVKKYGEKQTDPTYPEYVITDRQKENLFSQELLSLARTHQSFKAPAQNVEADLNGVVFND